MLLASCILDFCILVAHLTRCPMINLLAKAYAVSKATRIGVEIPIEWTAFRSRWVHMLPCPIVDRAVRLLAV
jgi:hypothetical protein